MPLIIGLGRTPAVQARSAGFVEEVGPGGTKRPVHRAAVQAQPAGPPRIVVHCPMGQPLFLTAEEARAEALRMLVEADRLDAGVEP